MTEFERNKYLEAYYENEADANKQMSIANAFGAALLLGIWICYMTGAFYASPKIMPLINMYILPLRILLLRSMNQVPQWWISIEKENYLKRHSY